MTKSSILKGIGTGAVTLVTVIALIGIGIGLYCCGHHNATLDCVEAMHER